MKGACPIPTISSYLQIPHVQKPIHSVAFYPVRALPSASFPRDRPPEHVQYILLRYQQLYGTCRLENPELRDPLFSVYNLSSETTLMALCDCNSSQVVVRQVKFIWNETNTSFLKIPYKIPVLTRHISSAVGVRTGMLFSPTVNNDCTWNAPLA